MQTYVGHRGTRGRGLGHPLPPAVQDYWIEPRKSYTAFYNSPVKVHANTSPPWYKGEFGQPILPAAQDCWTKKSIPCHLQSSGESTWRLLSPPWYKGEFGHPPVAQDFWNKASTLPSRSTLTVSDFFRHVAFDCIAQSSINAQCCQVN